MHLSAILTILLMCFGAFLVFNEKEGFGYLAVFGPVVFHAGNYVFNKKREINHSESE